MLAVWGQIAYSQTIVKTWETLLPGQPGGDDRTECMVLDGTHLVVASKIKKNGDETVRLAKHTLAGQQIWEKTWAIANRDLHPLRLVKSPAGGFVLFGYHTVVGDFVAKFDEDGDFLSEQFFPGRTISDMKMLPDGSFVFAGGRLGPLAPILAKYDATLNPVWEKTIALPYPVDDLNSNGIFALDLAPDGGFYLLARHDGETAPFYTDVIIAKTDADANLIWEKRVGFPTSDEVINDSYGGQAHSVILTHPDGGFVFNCRTNSPEYAPPSWPIPDFEDVLVLRYDDAGNQLWWQTSQFAAYNANGVALKPNGNVLVFGEGNDAFALNPAFNPTDLQETAFVLELDKQDGSVHWGESFGSLQPDFIRSVAAPGNDHFFACGNKNGQAWLFAVNVSGSSSSAAAPARPAELTVVPNPATEFADLVLPEKTSGWLSLADLSGRVLLAQSAHESQRFRVGLHGLPPGIYILQMVDESGPVRSARLVKQ